MKTSRNVHQRQLRPLVVISYSHEDEKWKKRLEVHLKVLEAQEFLELWDDRRMIGGVDWREIIETKIRSARLAIILVSANSLTSDFILHREVKLLIDQRRLNSLHIFPIVVMPCYWEAVDWLQKMNVRPMDGKPLSSGTDSEIDEELTKITKEIRFLLAQPPRSASRRSRRAAKLRRFTVSLEGNYEDLNGAKEIEITEEVKRLLKSLGLNVVEIIKGSIKLYVESSKTAYDLFRKAHEEGLLEELAELKILGIDPSRRLKYSPSIGQLRRFGTAMYYHDRFYTSILGSLLVDLGERRPANLGDAEPALASAIREVEAAYLHLRTGSFLGEHFSPMLRQFQEHYKRWAVGGVEGSPIFDSRPEFAAMRRARREMTQFIRENVILVEFEVEWDLVSRIYRAMAPLEEFKSQLPTLYKSMRHSEPRQGDTDSKTSAEVENPGHELRLIVRRLFGRKLERVQRGAFDSWSLKNIAHIHERDFRAFRALLIRRFQFESRSRLAKNEIDDFLENCSAVLREVRTKKYAQ